MFPKLTLILFRSQSKKMWRRKNLQRKIMLRETGWARYLLMSDYYLKRGELGVTQDVRFSTHFLWLVGWIWNVKACCCHRGEVRQYHHFLLERHRRIHIWIHIQYTCNGRNGKIKPDILAANKNKKTTIAFLWQLLDSRSTEMSKWKYTFLERNKGYWVVVYFTGVFCTTDTLTNFGARDIHKLLSLCACTLNMMC